jgi:hypothetical protein
MAKKRWIPARYACPAGVSLRWTEECAISEHFGAKELAKSLKINAESTKRPTLNKLSTTAERDGACLYFQ